MPRSVAVVAPPARSADRSAATTLLARVEHLDRAVVSVQLCDRCGRPWTSPLECRPAHWRTLRHILAIGEAMRGGHLEVQDVRRIA